ncbi:hypothetical protein [Providencia rettgeri]|uniref:hypothetical protein n=1 Tax=Providencia rettgeri TaxID=587 RepID=UPI0034E05B23
MSEKGMAEAASKVSLLELDKVLSIIISALGTSLGFSIGYYFKEKKGEQPTRVGFLLPEICIYPSICALNLNMVMYEKGTYCGVINASLF